MAKRQIRTRAAQRPNKGYRGPIRATQRQHRLNQGDASPARVAQRLTQGRRANAELGKAVLGFQWARKGLFSTNPKGVKQPH